MTTQPPAIEAFICRTDNIGVLLHDAASGATLAIDAPDAAAITAVLQRRGWQLSHILVTHHHADHTAGIAALKAASGAEIIAPAREAARIPAVDRTIAGGDTIALAGRRITAIDTPGHTNGHLAFHLPDDRLVFTGDALFALGCGRIIEGDAATLWRSLDALRRLPGDTAVYCGHDYTRANARFALTVEPENAALADRAASLGTAAGLTLPGTIADELATNPFLRPDSPAIQQRLGMVGQPLATIFAELRQRKDRA